jgi:hypothetical protein
VNVTRQPSGEWREETFFKPGYPTAGVLYELTDMPDAKVGDRLVLAISDGSEITAVAVEIETHIEQDGSSHQMVNFQFDPPLQPDESKWGHTCRSRQDGAQSEQSGRMPSEAIPVLRVIDADSTSEWYRRLGFKREWEHRFEPSLPAFVSLVRDHGTRVFLSEHTGDAPPDGLLYLRLSDVGAVAREFGVEAVEQPWGSEVRLTDPDGNQVRVGELRA